MSRLKLSIEYLPIEQLIPSSRNARTHSKKQKALIADSIKRFGMVTPVGIGPDNCLVYGDARVEAAKLAGLETVPVVRLDHLNADERRAYLLADNRLALESGWDRELLALELKELETLNFSLPVLGFTLPEIDSLYEDLDNANIEGNDPVEDNIPVRSDHVVTQADHMWLLGNHWLVRGDARDQLVYDRVLGGELIDVVFADPPYNVRIENNVSRLGQVRHGDFAMASGEMSPEQFTDFLKSGFTPVADRMRSGAIAFVCMDWRHMVEMQLLDWRCSTTSKTYASGTKEKPGWGPFIVANTS